MSGLGVLGIIVIILGVLGDVGAESGVQSEFGVVEVVGGAELVAVVLGLGTSKPVRRARLVGAFDPKARAVLLLVLKGLVSYVDNFLVCWVVRQGGVGLRRVLVLPDEALHRGV